jgi:hypothetical protein
MNSLRTEQKNSQKFNLKKRLDSTQKNKTIINAGFSVTNVEKTSWNMWKPLHMHQYVAHMETITLGTKHCLMSRQNK